MKIKIVSSPEELESAPWEEFTGHIEIGCAAISSRLNQFRTVMETAETVALIHAIEQQIAAWEDC